MATLGEARVNIRANLAPFKRGLTTARGLVTKALSTMSRRLFTGLSSIIKSTMRTITRTVRNAVRIVTAAFIAIGAASVKFAVDAEESANLFEVSMGSMVIAAKEFTREMSRSLGLNETSIKKYISTFNLMLTGMGIAPEKAFEVSKSLTKLTFDLASFRNLRFEEAFTKLAAGITGESEPLKRLGILVNETRIKTRALTTGLIEEKQELTDIQKVLLRVDEIMAQTTKDQGDFARTANQGANVFRRFTDQLRTTGEDIGRVLLPQVIKVTEAFRKWLVENKPQIQAFTQAVVNAVRRVVNDIRFLLAGLDQGDFIKRVKFLARRIIGELKAEFENAKPQLIAIGKTIGIAIGEGIVDGIKALTGKVEIGASPISLQKPSGGVGLGFGLGQVGSL